MILVNVLMIVAIASGLVLLMISREELGLDRALRLRDAARAQAAVRGGELSAVVALRRDAQTAPEVDYAGEAWGKVAERAAPIDGGTFDLAIADAEGRFNINLLRGEGAGQQLAFTAIAKAAGLEDAQMARIAALVKEGPPITDLRPLRFAGLAPETVDRLERMVTALPGTTTINLNAADPELLKLLFRNDDAVDRLVAIRKAQGYVTERTLGDLQLSAPPGTGFTSHSFWVRTRATIGGTTQQEVALVQRQGEGRDAVAVPVERWRNAAVPPGVPEF